MKSRHISSLLLFLDTLVSVPTWSSRYKSRNSNTFKWTY